MNASDIILEYIAEDLPEIDPKHALLIEDDDMDIDISIDNSYIILQLIEEEISDLPIEGSMPIDISCEQVYAHSQWRRK